MPNRDEVTWTVSNVTDDQYLVLQENRSGKAILRVPRNPTVVTISPTFGPGSPMIKMEFPLSIGSKSTAYFVGTTSRGAAANSWRTDWTVAKVESVTVAAGTFQAYLANGIQCNLTINLCGDVHVWFAPQAKNIVRITWGSDSYWSPVVRGKSEELVKYTVH